MPAKAIMDTIEPADGGLITLLAILNGPTAGHTRIAIQFGSTIASVYLTPQELDGLITTLQTFQELP